VQSKPSIFISYSHKDARWKDRLVKHLRVLAPEQAIAVWDDRRIAAGMSWRAETEEAINSATVVILLVSPDYLASDFIMSAELPGLLARRRRAEALPIVPVIVSPCPWRKIPWLSRLQVRPHAGHSLSEMTESTASKELAAIAVEIGDLLRRKAAAQRSALSDVPLQVSRVRLTGVRRFANLDVDVSHPGGKPRACTVFVGKNGCCKTTLLRCLALGLADTADTNALVAEPTGRLLANGVNRGIIALHLLPRDGGPEALTLEKEIGDVDGKDVVTAAAPSIRFARFPFICAYGAGRFGMGPDSGRPYRPRDSVASLFDYRQTLHDAELTLRRIRDSLGTERYTATLSGLKRVLGLSEADEIAVAEGGGIRLSGPTVGRGVPFEAWADGYRMTFAWLLDLYAWAFKANRIAADGQVEGIVLIDELEQHLHPSMQAAILPRLRAVLPHVQWFITTHSPLVALGAEPGEVVLLREQGSQVVAEPANFDFSGYSAEDMLVDERLFDTIPYAPPTARKLERYRELTTMQPEQRTPAQTDELRGLARELRSQQLPEVRGGEAERELRALLDKHGL